MSEGKSVADMTKEQIREWWASLSDEQKAEVSFYADAATWSAITRAIIR